MVSECIKSIYYFQKLKLLFMLLGISVCMKNIDVLPTKFNTVHKLLLFFFFFFFSCHRLGPLASSDSELILYI
jgi:hypothetical protein